MNQNPMNQENESCMPQPSQSTSSPMKWIIGGGVMLLALIMGLAAYMVLLPRMEKGRYALDYPETIAKQAAEYELDPYLVAAVIHVESRGNPDAESPKGAVGLMQIMPKTGEWVAEKMKRSFDVLQLTDPEINIEMGCWYLNFLNGLFPVQDTALAAYNAGQGNVSKWLKDERYSQNQEDLLDIPFPETKNYVKRVQEAYEKYKEFYPEAFA